MDTTFERHGDTAYSNVSYDGRSGCYERHGYDKEGLSQLLWVLHAYDNRLRTLETEGGDRDMLRDTADLLRKEVVLAGCYGEAKVSLSDPDRLRGALFTVGQSDVALAVRRLSHGMPAYYVGRVQRDWWNLYSLVVEDLYRSPGYPFLDERFARFMVHGHERYFLRLSLLRNKAADALGGCDTEAPEVDALIYALGRSLFQGAWHADQRFAFVLAKAFEAPRLRDAIELTYLCLSCDLSSLRRFLSKPMQRFFEQHYDNPSIAELLRRLETMTGAEMTALAQRGLEAYQDLAAGVSAVLSHEVMWAEQTSAPTPLWKLGVANVGRLTTMAEQLRPGGSFTLVRTQFTELGECCIGKLLENAA